MDVRLRAAIIRFIYVDVNGLFDRTGDFRPGGIIIRGVQRNTVAMDGVCQRSGFALGKEPRDNFLRKFLEWPATHLSHPHSTLFASLLSLSLSIRPYRLCYCARRSSKSQGYERVWKNFLATSHGQKTLRLASAFENGHRACNVLLVFEATLARWALQLSSDYDRFTLRPVKGRRVRSIDRLILRASAWSSMVSGILRR